MKLLKINEYINESSWKYEDFATHVNNKMFDKQAKVFVFDKRNSREQRNDVAKIFLQKHISSNAMDSIDDNEYVSYMINNYIK